MKFVYKGKFESYDQLPIADLPENAVMFKEPDTIEELSKIAGKWGFVAAIPVVIVIVLKNGIALKNGCFEWSSFSIFAGCLAFFVSMFPHELLHGICWTKDAEVEIYQAIKKGMLFVISTSPVTKRRFIGLSLCPNLVFGLLSFIIYIFAVQGSFLSGFLGMFCFLSVTAAGGDILNVINCIRQVPDGAMVVLSGIHSYWYRKEE